MNDDYGTVLSPTEVRFQRLLPGPIETGGPFLRIRRSAANGSHPARWSHASAAR
jgi:hypothetical protein